MSQGFDSLRPGRKSRRGLAKFESILTEKPEDMGQIFVVESGSYRCLLCGKVRNSLRSIKRHDKQRHQGRLKPTNVFTKKQNAAGRAAALLLAAVTIMGGGPLPLQLEGYGRGFRSTLDI